MSDHFNFSPDTLRVFLIVRLSTYSDIAVAAD